MVKWAMVLWIGLTGFSLKAASQLSWKAQLDTGLKRLSLTVVPQNFYTQHTGFICKQEAKLQKKTALPIYIRLGSKQYVDYMEQKPNAVKQ